MSTYVTLRFASNVSAQQIADRLTDYRYLALAGGWPFELYDVTTVPKGRRLVIATRKLGFRAHDPDMPLLPWCSPPEYGQHDGNEEALRPGRELRSGQPANRRRTKVDQHEPDPAHHGYDVRHQPPPTLPRQQSRSVEVTPG